MSGESTKQAEAIRAAASGFSASFGGELVQHTSEASALVRSWIGYLQGATPSDSTRVLLDAARSSIVESAGCLSLGLVRPAVFSIRTELELVLSWLFYRDHPVEWRHIQRTGRSFRSRSATLKYLNDYGDRFKDRFSILLRSKERQLEDPYELLSIHVHSLIDSAMPDANNLESLVRDPDVCHECVKLQGDVTEYLSDVLASWHADNWPDLPSDIKENISRRLSESKLGEFCR